MLTPYNFTTWITKTLNLQAPPSAQAPTPPGTSLILAGALLLVLIILGSILWIASRRK